MKIRFCYKMTKEAEVAVDEDGNFDDAFACIKLESKEPISEESYKDAHEFFRRAMANQLETDIENVIPISVDEYLDNTEDGEYTQDIYIDSQLGLNEGDD